MGVLGQLVRGIALLVIGVFVLSYITDYKASHPAGPGPSVPGLATGSSGGPPAGWVVELGKDLGPNAPKPPGMTSRDWCLQVRESWKQQDVDISDDSDCQGQPMRHWLAEEGHPV
jgi:hypothetical protein